MHIWLRPKCWICTTEWPQYCRENFIFKLQKIIQQGGKETVPALTPSPFWKMPRSAHIHIIPYPIYILLSHSGTSPPGSTFAIPPWELSASKRPALNTKMPQETCAARIGASIVEPWAPGQLNQCRQNLFVAIIAQINSNYGRMSGWTSQCQAGFNVIQWESTLQPIIAISKLMVLESILKMMEHMFNGCK